MRSSPLNARFPLSSVPSLHTLANPLHLLRITPLILTLTLGNALAAPASVKKETPDQRGEKTRVVQPPVEHIAQDQSFLIVSGDSNSTEDFLKGMNFHIYGTSVPDHPTWLRSLSIYQRKGAEPKGNPARGAQLLAHIELDGLYGKDFKGSAKWPRIKLFRPGSEPKTYTLPPPPKPGKRADVIALPVLITQEYEVMSLLVNSELSRIVDLKPLSLEFKHIRKLDPALGTQHEFSSFKMELRPQSSQLQRPWVFTTDDKVIEDLHFFVMRGEPSKAYPDRPAPEVGIDCIMPTNKPLDGDALHWFYKNKKCSSKK